MDEECAPSDEEDIVESDNKVTSSDGSESNDELLDDQEKVFTRSGRRIAPSRWHATFAPH